MTIDEQQINFDEKCPDCTVDKICEKHKVIELTPAEKKAQKEAEKARLAEEIKRKQAEFDALHEISDELNEKQELFCKLYATDREFFGNGTRSYIEAYNPPREKENWYDIASASASRLLRNVKIYTRINAILAETGLNDVAVDKQMSMLIHQHADFSSKLGAIKEYNKLKQRIINKSDLMSGGKEIKGNVIIFKDFSEASVEEKEDEKE